MSDYDGGDAGHYDTGAEHTDLDHGHEVYGNEQDHLQQFNVLGEDHNATDATHFENGHHVEYDNPNEHASESDYTDYDHQATESDHVFAAEGSDQSHSESFAELDHLHQELDAEFAHGGTVLDGGPALEGGAAGVSAVSG